MKCMSLSIDRIRAIASRLEKDEASRELAAELYQIADDIERRGLDNSGRKMLVDCIEKVVRLAPGITALIEFIRNMNDG